MAFKGSVGRDDTPTFSNAQGKHVLCMRLSPLWRTNALKSCRPFGGQMQSRLDESRALVAHRGRMLRPMAGSHERS